MTIIDLLKNNIIPESVKIVAKQENLSVEYIKNNILNGTVVIPLNNKKKLNRNFKVTGIGKGLRTKINANIGTSSDKIDIENELEKLRIAIKYGADTVMDLSTGGNLKKIREKIIKNSNVPVGTVPIYQTVCEVLRKSKNIKYITPNHIFDVIQQHCEDGVDFITVHCGVNKKTTEIFKKYKRICGIVSRGGAFLTEWILVNNKENPLYENFDKLLNIVKKYDVTLSLGDGLRPGSILDANDRLQIQELQNLSELVKEARKNNVQVIVEGPGHMPINTIEKHVKLEKKITRGAPFYLLGPLVTDIAAGYDHITSAIGASIAAGAGADFICYVTPAEHIKLPDVEDVKLGVIASRIAAHVGDIVKNVSGSIQWDKEISIARNGLDWEKQAKLSIDEENFLKQRKKSFPKNKQVCSMCGKYCAMREINSVLSNIK